MGDDQGDGDRPVWPELLRPDRFLALCGLTGFAISQPLLSVAGENPTLFTFAGVEGMELVAFAVVVAFLPPVVLWSIVLVADRIDRRAGSAVFVGLAAILVGATAVQLAKAAGFGRPALLGATALVATVGFAVLLRRWRWVDQWVRFTSPLPVVAVLAFVLVSPSGALLGGPDPETSRSDASGGLPPVVVVMLDELPLASMLDESDSIDPVRFPNLASLAEDATWYRNYTVMASRTVHSVPSILSGRAPEDGEPLWTDHPDTIFSLLAPTHDLNVSESLTRLCGYETCTGPDESDGPSAGRLTSVLGSIADIWVDRVALRPTGDPDLGQFRDEVVPLDGEATAGTVLGDADQVVARPERVTEFLQALRPGPRPTLHYLHLLLPHQPWIHHPDGALYQAPGLSLEAPGQAMWAPGAAEWKVAVANQQHLFQAQYADRLVGEVLERLRSTRLYDDALIVVTADHGVSFRGDEIQRHPGDDATMGDIAFVPLLVKAPGQTLGHVDDANLMAIDLLPLVAGELGIDIPWAVDGFEPSHPAVGDRGTGKDFYDFGTGITRAPLRGVDRYDASVRPRGTSRLVGAVGPGSHPLGGLVEGLGSVELLDTELDDLDLEPVEPRRGRAFVRELDRVRVPAADQPRLGMLWGRLEVPDDGGRVLVALDGRIVSMAPFGTEGQLNALLPPAALDGSGHALRLAVLSDDGERAYELEVLPAMVG